MKTFTVREKATKGIDFHFHKEGPPNEIFGIPVGQALLKEFHDLNVPEARATLDWLDVVQDGDKLRIIKEQNMRDRRALVVVETAGGLGGTVKLYANTMSEEVDEKTHRVVRKANAFPPPGVELIAERQSSVGPEFLVSMLPGASFRIVRSGKLPKDAAPELVVLWNGRWDFNAARDPRRRTDMKNWSGFSIYDRSMRHGRV